MKRRIIVSLYTLLLAIVMCACAHETNAPAPDENSINIYVINNCSGKIATMALRYSVNGTVMGSEGTVHANGSAFSKGEIMRFLIPAESSGNASCLTIELYAGEDAGKDSSFCGQADIFDPGSGKSYYYKVSDDSGNYSLSVSEPR